VIAKSKQIVIDKDLFQGTPRDKLYSFAQNHFLVLSQILYGEIITDSKNYERLLKRFRETILSGAYFCRSTRSMIKREGQSSQPYGFLSDLEETSDMRLHLRRGNRFIMRDEKEAAERNMDSARVLLNNCTVVIQKLLLDTITEADRNRVKLEGSKEDRLRFWVDKADVLDVHVVAASAFKNLVKSANRFSLSREWVSWQYIRLSTVLYLEYTFLRKGSGREKELVHAEHDLHDIEYVVLLNRADALLTGDKHFVKPLAKAAFPDKDVFSSLDEVPKDYICNWTQ